MAKRTLKAVSLAELGALQNPIVESTTTETAKAILPGRVIETLKGGKVRIDKPAPTKDANIVPENSLAQSTIDKLSKMKSAIAKEYAWSGKDATELAGFSSRFDEFPSGVIVTSKGPDTSKGEATLFATFTPEFLQTVGLSEVPMKDVKEILAPIQCRFGGLWFGGKSLARPAGWMVKEAKDYLLFEFMAESAIKLASLA